MPRLVLHLIDKWRIINMWLKHTVTYLTISVPCQLPNHGSVSITLQSTSLLCSSSTNGGTAEHYATAKTYFFTSKYVSCIYIYMYMIVKGGEYVSCIYMYMYMIVKGEYVHRILAPPVWRDILRLQSSSDIICMLITVILTSTITLSTLGLIYMYIYIFAVIISHRNFSRRRDRFCLWISLTGIESRSRGRFWYEWRRFHPAGYRLQYLHDENVGRLCLHRVRQKCVSYPYNGFPCMWPSGTLYTHVALLITGTK